MDQAQPQLALNQPTAKVLTWGFRLSAALLLIGLAISAARGEELHTSVENIPGILDNIADGNGAGVVALAILVMIVTPIVSTFSIVLSCIRIGDQRYALITGLVLVILIISAAVSAL